METFGTNSEICGLRKRHLNSAHSLSIRKVINIHHFEDLEKGKCAPGQLGPARLELLAKFYKVGLPFCAIFIQAITLCGCAFRVLTVD